MSSIGRHFDRISDLWMEEESEHVDGNAKVLYAVIDDDDDDCLMVDNALRKGRSFLISTNLWIN